MIRSPGETARFARRHSTMELVSPLDTDLIRIAYAVIGDHTCCARCRRPLRNALRVRAQTPSFLDVRGSGSISLRCCGWRRRHRNEAWISLREDGLHLGRPGPPVRGGSIGYAEDVGLDRKLVLLRRVAQQRVLARALGFSRRVRAAWKDDNAGGLAAEVAFFALLSVFPGLLAVVAAVGWLDGLFGEELLREAERRVLGLLETFLSANAAGSIDTVRALFRRGSGGVFTLGVLAALWSASRGTAALLRAIAAIYAAQEERSAIRRRLLAVGVALGSMIVVALMLAMLVLGPLLGAGRAGARAVGLHEAYGSLWEWLGIPVAFVVLVAWVVVILHAAAHLHKSWRTHLLAAALAGSGWVLSSLAFRAYLAVFGGNPVFGVLGGALVILLWLYVLSLVLMLAAEVNAVLDAGNPTRDGSVTEARRSLEATPPRERGEPWARAERRESVMMWPYPAWTYPTDRYYYGWYEVEPPVKTDRDIKLEVIDHLRQNPYTTDEDITVDVEHDVVVLSGQVRSSRAKRAAGDDAWDVPGVADVSNQLTVRRSGQR